MLIDNSVAYSVLAFGMVDVPSKQRMNFRGNRCRSLELVSYENFG